MDHELFERLAVIRFLEVKTLNYEGVLPIV